MDSCSWTRNFTEGVNRHKKKVLTRTHWHIKCVLFKTPRLLFFCRIFSSSKEPSKKKAEEEWTKAPCCHSALKNIPCMMPANFGGHGSSWTPSEPQLISDAARETKSSWCCSQKEQDLFFLLTSKLMPAVGKAMGDLLEGEPVVYSIPLCCIGE